jgi:hypothetical protein
MPGYKRQQQQSACRGIPEAEMNGVCNNFVWNFKDKVPEVREGFVVWQHFQPAPKHQAFP